MENRPELMAQTLRIRAEVRIRAASAEYKPQTALSGSDAQTSLWPSADWVSSVPRSSLLGPSND
jgi:outer membrane protein TolC